MKQRSLSARLWDRLGVATTRAAVADAARLNKRLDRCDKRAERAHELLESIRTQLLSLAGTVDDLRTGVAKLQEALDAASDQASLLALARKHDLESNDALSRLMAALDQAADGVEAHIDRAMAGAAVVVDPFPHMVIHDLLPAAVCRTLLEALPPPAYWRSSGRAREYWEIESNARGLDRPLLSGAAR